MGQAEAVSPKCEHQHLPTRLSLEEKRWRDTGKTATCRWRRRPSDGLTSQGTLRLEEAGRIPLEASKEHDLGLLAPEQERIHFCCLKPPGCGIWGQQAAPGH